MSTSILYTFLDERSLLKRLLSSSSPDEAWSEFLRRYSNLFFKVIWKFEHDHDTAVDRYLFVCTKLAENNFARLRKFRTEFGDRPPKLSTWLVAVTHNLCIDAHRAAHGRRRLPAAVSAMPETDRTVFRLFYWQGRSVDEVQHMLNGQLNGRSIPDILDDIENAVGGRQRPLRPEFVRFEPEQHAPVTDDMDSPDEDPEWLSMLDAQERRVVRLRFWEDMSAKEIASILNLTSAQTVHTIMHRALTKLRGRVPKQKSAPKDVRDIQEGQ